MLIRTGAKVKVVSTQNHQAHRPIHQFEGHGMGPCPEVPERVEAILLELRRRGLAEEVATDALSLDAIRAVHDPDYLAFLEKAYNAHAARGGDASVGLIPDTFAVRGLGGRPRDLVRQAGYYCFETQTPIVEATYAAALASAGCAQTAARLLLEGERTVYALCRPPGHHAGRAVYGGYCYLNNAAIAVTELIKRGRVAILDVDYHHGNGTQGIYYGSGEVLFASIHGDPNRQYPFFSGFVEETGEGAGLGTTLNLPLEPGTGKAGYLVTLDRALDAVASFAPAHVVVSFGADTCREDPLGGFDLSVSAFAQIGERLANTGLPTLVVQEGGYGLDVLGACVSNLLEGLGGV
ncbi:MAG: histone deacetylase family protein [Candidatus Latescibacteria bacterium]|nr:histone deacetylase family protein [Candidatus Latescibacterota bacterium]